MAGKVLISLQLILLVLPAPICSKPVDELDVEPIENELDDKAKPSPAASSIDLDKIIPELPGDLIPEIPDLIDTTCKKLNESCDLFPRCCGDLVCYWEDGFNFEKNGRCVECVALSLTCHRSGQCCESDDMEPGIQNPSVCDKGTQPFNDGVCAKKRSEGKCYKNKQCVKQCKKNWYNPFTGLCI